MDIASDVVAAHGLAGGATVSGRACLRHGRALAHATFVALLLLWHPHAGRAEPVPGDQAWQVARGFVRLNPGLGTARLRLAATSPHAIRPLRDGGGNLIAWVVDLAPRGFVVVCADDAVEPVIAFSTEEFFGASLPAPDVLTDMLAADIPGRVRASKLQAACAPMSLEPAAATAAATRSRVAERWQAMARASLGQVDQSQAPGVVVMDALLPTTWHQVDPYSRVTQAHIGSDPPYPAGCVATALGQVIRYFEYPPRASCTNAVTVGGQRRTFSFDRSYTYSNMPWLLDVFSTTTQINAVGELLWNVGVAVGMNYTRDERGRPVGLSSLSGPGVNALLGTFGYRSATYESGTSATCLSHVRASLEDRLPVPMAIRSSAGDGHIIVCDGYSRDSHDTDYYHLNLGWRAPVTAGTTSPTAASVWATATGRSCRGASTTSRRPAARPSASSPRSTRRPMAARSSCLPERMASA